MPICVKMPDIGSDNRDISDQLMISWTTTTRGRWRLCLSSGSASFEGPSLCGLEGESLEFAIRCSSEGSRIWTETQQTSQCCRVWWCNHVHYRGPEGPNETCVVPLRISGEVQRIKVIKHFRAIDICGSWRSSESLRVLIRTEPRSGPSWSRKFCYLMSEKGDSSVCLVVFKCDSWNPNTFICLFNWLVCHTSDI